MENFTKILIGAIVIGLAYYYYKQFKNYSDEQDKLTWPREISECPDYWVKTDKGACRNQFNIGHCPRGSNGLTTPQGIVDFNTNVYKGENGNYNKCRWAKRCAASWEGIDNLCA
jgi:hypothetical protein